MPLAVSLGTIAPLFLTALLLPLFPFHGVYVAALTRSPRRKAIVLPTVLPLIGICAAAVLLPAMPPELMPAVTVLAAFGAIWGSFKALVQVHALPLLSYAGLALYSVLWWHLARAGSLTADGALYAVAVTLVISGLVLAWDCVRVRFGDLDLNRIGGLFRPMPRFALCMALLIMAAVGLPPFGLFFGYMGMLLSPSTGISGGLVVIVISWLGASWYLFQFMRRLLFGPHRPDVFYKDLGAKEISAFVSVLALLVILGGVPQDLLESAIASITAE
jgi:NADH-quinone oxidoreductase subunit M